MISTHRLMATATALGRSVLGRSVMGASLLALCLALGASAGCGGAQGAGAAAPETAAPADTDAPAAASADGVDGEQVPAADGPPGTQPAAPALSATALGPQIGGGQVRFNFKPSYKAKKIYLAGSFNGWDPSDSDYLLKDEDGDGIWSITIPLGAGSYQYKFVADGQWTKDPSSPKAAPDGFGGQNGAFDVP